MGQYHNYNIINKNSNPGIHVKSKQINTNVVNVNQRHRSIVGHHNSPIAKNDAQKVINQIKHMQLNEKQVTKMNSMQGNNFNQVSLQECTQTGSQMDDIENEISFDERTQNAKAREAGQVSVQKKTLDELASS